MGFSTGFSTNFFTDLSLAAVATGLKHWQPKARVMTIAGLLTGLIIPIVSVQSAFAQTRFTDVPQGYWAENFIQNLTDRGIIAGFPDGQFRPNDPVTRAQYAAMVRNAFSKARIRNSMQFVDVPVSYWAEPAITQAYAMGFMAGYPGNIFNPNQNIPRAQVLVSLANGLNFTSNNLSVLQTFSDANAIPAYALNSIAAATENRMVVNYPNVQLLNPNQSATRADVAAFIYQALASQGQTLALNSPYIVGVAVNPPNYSSGNPSSNPTRIALSAGSSIPVHFTEAEEVVFLPSETLATTLTVRQNVVNNTGQIVVAQGSRVIGEFRPSGEGSVFVAREMILTTGQRLALSALSPTLTETETLREGINPAIVAGSAVFGAGAAAAIEGLTGRRTINASEVLAGGAAGAIVGTIADNFLGRKSVEVIKLNRNTNLSLLLNGDFVLP